jgi:hypothetical protein
MYDENWTKTIMDCIAFLILMGAIYAMLRFVG